MGSEELGPTETVGSASKQEGSAEAQAVEQAPEAGPSDVPDSDDPDMLHPKGARRAPARLSQGTATKNSSSLSPQPSPQLHASMPLEQRQSPDLPSRPAPAAHAPPLAAQEEGPWQEVKSSRRKQARQQPAAKAGATMTPRQGRSAPDRDTPAPSASRQREWQTPAAPPREALQHPRKAEQPAHSQHVRVATEQLPPCLPASAARNAHQPSQQHELSPVHPPGPLDLLFSTQHEPLRAMTDGNAAHEARATFQQKPHTGSRTGASHEQVCILALPGFI